MARPAALPKAVRAVIAAHEAGMHDKVPKPETCRDCAAEARFAQVGRDAIAKAPEPVKRIARRAQVIETPDGKTVIAIAPEPAPVLGTLTDVPEPVVPMAKPGDVIEVTGMGGNTATVTIASEYRSREEWMQAAVEAMRPWIADVGAPVGAVRISFGWPGGRGSKKNVRGQCWMPEAVKDRVPSIFVSPAMEREETVTILGIILHEMNHAAGHLGHVGAFAKTAAALGFGKPWTSSEAKDDALKARLSSLAEKLGPLDHAAINAVQGLKGTGPTAPPVQSTRMLKVFCTEDGYTLRATAKWLNTAIPSCPLCDAEMSVEWK